MPGANGRAARTGPGVQELFSNPPYDRLKDRFHQVFGPTGKDGNLLRPSSKHSTEYFRQSVSENESLDKTIGALKELETQGTASPGVRKALESHKKRMQDIGLDEQKIKGTKRLFFTATPRIVSRKLKTSENEGIEFNSMDDQIKFGKVLYQLNFGAFYRKQIAFVFVFYRTNAISVWPGYEHNSFSSDKNA